MRTIAMARRSAGSLLAAALERGARTTQPDAGTETGRNRNPGGVRGPGVRSRGSEPGRAGAGTADEAERVADALTAEIQAAAAGAEAERRPIAWPSPSCCGGSGSREPVVVSLTDCAGRPNPAALRAGQRDWRSRKRRASDDADDRRLSRAQPVPAAQSGAAGAVQRVAEQFPGRAIEIVSGYRTRARATSRHRSGDALDLRVDGVDNEELSEFARTLEATGVGFYPNSTFVHVDVRAASAYWVDRSGPGEKPDVRAPRAPIAPTSALPRSRSRTAPAACRRREAADEERAPRGRAARDTVAEAATERDGRARRAGVRRPSPRRTSRPEPNARMPTERRSAERDAAELAPSCSDSAERRSIVMRARVSLARRAARACAPPARLRRAMAASARPASARSPMTPATRPSPFVASAASSSTWMAG